MSNNPLTRNPLTGQILASIDLQTDEEAPPTLVAEIWLTYAQAMRLGLPEIAPAVMGEVLLHAALRYRDVIAPALGLSANEINLVTNLLAGAGESLYRGETSST